MTNLCNDNVLKARPSFNGNPYNSRHQCSTPHIQLFDLAPWPHPTNWNWQTQENNGHFTNQVCPLVLHLGDQYLLDEDVTSPLQQTWFPEALWCQYESKNGKRRRKVSRPFTSSPGPLFQNEGRCTAFDMEIIFHSHANKTHFHKKGCARSLILKVRVSGTRKWPINYPVSQVTNAKAK